MARADAVLNLIVDLTKRIHLRAGVTPEATELTQFIAPRDPARWYEIAGGVGLTWWAAADYLRRVDGFAEVVIETDADLSGGDVKSFQETFLDTLKRHALDAQLFDRTRIFSRSVPTLFEARAEQNVDVWRRRVWDTVRTALLESIREWLVIYPLHPVVGKAFSLGFDGLSILDPSDASSWASLASRYPALLRDWDPKKGYRGSDDMMLYGGPPSRWLACEVGGTARGATARAADRMWTFLALFLAHFYSATKSILVRLHARTPYLCGQFSSATASDGPSYSQREIGALLPHQVETLNVTDDLIRAITTWYATRASTDDEGRQRATVASHFVHYGINADRNVERYVHFYVALDALFGRRGQVEIGIRDGFTKLFAGDANWIAKAGDLFELRNELIHGGASMIETWSGFDGYVRHFKSTPLDDLSDAAMRSLREYFTVRDLPLRRSIRTRVLEMFGDIGRAWRRFRT